MCLVQYLNVYVKIYGDPPETKLNKKKMKKKSSHFSLFLLPSTALCQRSWIGWRTRGIEKYTSNPKEAMQVLWKSHSQRMESQGQ